MRRPPFEHICSFPGGGEKLNSFFLDLGVEFADGVRGDIGEDELALMRACPRPLQYSKR